MKYVDSYRIAKGNFLNYIMVQNKTELNCKMVNIQLFELQGGEVKNELIN